MFKVWPLLLTWSFLWSFPAFFCSHFRGGTISWKPDASIPLKVHFKFKIAWRRGSQFSGNDCEGHLLGNNQKWICESGACNGDAVGSTDYYCSSQNVQDDWIQGENSFNFTFPSDGSYNISYTGCCWIALVPPQTGSSDWVLGTTVNLETRRDKPGVINSSPISATQPVHVLRQGCPVKIRIEVADPDTTDIVRCRWADGHSECGGACTEHELGILDQASCTLSYNGQAGIGMHAVAVILEDFYPGSTSFNPSDALSKVGLQFLVNVTSNPHNSCAMPLLTNNSPPDGACVAIPSGQTYRATLEASHNDNSQIVSDISISAPPGMNKAPVTETGTDSRGHRIWSTQIAWTPQDSQFGQHIFCFKAKDNFGQESSQRCLTLLAGSDAPRAVLSSRSPNTTHLTPSGKYTWSITFDNKITRPSSPRFIRFKASTGHTVYTIDTSSSPDVHIDNTTNTLHFMVDGTLLVGYRSYHILMDQGVVEGPLGCYGSGPASPVISSLSTWTFTIGCEPGFVLNSARSNCTDIDECATGNGNCSHQCNNTVGSYRCACPDPGFTLSAEGKTCKDIDECARANGNCSHQCDNAAGSYRCACPDPGLTLSATGKTCKDIDECATANGNCSHQCNNTAGSYRCACPDPGLTLSATGKTCKDVDECATGDGKCSHQCINTAGSYRCACPDPGLTLSADGKTCKDVDECATGNGKCSHQCNNMEGSYRCACPDPGLTLNTDGKTCTDIDECATGNGKCSHQCNNTVGSYRCACPDPGLTLSTDEKTCKDIDECATGNGNCSHQCNNTVGSYHCACPDPGLTLNMDGKTCKAVGMAVKCTSDSMLVIFTRQMLSGLDDKHVSLNDPSCHVVVNTTDISFLVPLEGCGTTHTDTADSITYKNKVIVRDFRVGAVITRVGCAEIVVSCSYGRKKTFGFVGFRPKTRILRAFEYGYGNFTFLFNMLHTASYLEPFADSEYPIDVKLRQQLYFQLQVKCNDSDLVLFVDSCKATPTLKPNAKPEYRFISSGCNLDSTLVYNYTLLPIQRFNMEAFRFIALQSVVFIHCDVIVCHKSANVSRCAQGCVPGSRKRRELSQGVVPSSAHYVISEGPLRFAAESSQDKVVPVPSGVEYSSSVPLFVTLAFIATISCMSVIIIALNKKKCHGTPYQLVSREEVQPQM